MVFDDDIFPYLSPAKLLFGLPIIAPQPYL